MDLTLLTAVAVFFHLGTSIAASLMKDQTDQAKIAALNSKVDQIFGIVSAIAPAIPTTTPKNLTAGLTDVAQVAGAIVAATTPVAAPATTPVAAPTTTPVAAPVAAGGTS